MMAVENVDDGAAIGNHVPFEFPFVAELIFEQKRAGASGLAVDAVVGAHDRAGSALRYRIAERREVSVYLVVLADVDVGFVARGFGAAVNGEMFWRGDDAVVARIVALHAGDEGGAHAAGEKRIFAVGYMAAAPARLAEDVDGGRPEVETLPDAAGAGADRLHVMDAAFAADDDCHFVD